MASERLAQLYPAEGVAEGSMLTYAALKNLHERQAKVPRTQFLSRVPGKFGGGVDNKKRTGILTSAGLRTFHMFARIHQQERTRRRRRSC